MSATTKAAHTAGRVTAEKWVQGYCPKPWVALVDGEAIRTSAGGLRRYLTEHAALKAGRAAIAQVQQ